MPRPRKCRRVCGLPGNVEFIPGSGACGKEPIFLTVDEYETIRLIDKEGLSQEECGALMEVAHTTAQQIYNSARKKLAEALVNGLPLKIEGGDYRLCEKSELCRGCPRCPMHCCCPTAKENQEDQHESSDSNR